MWFYDVTWIPTWNLKEFKDQQLCLYAMQNLLPYLYFHIIWPFYNYEVNKNLKTMNAITSFSGNTYYKCQSVYYTLCIINFVLNVCQTIYNSKNKWE